MFCASGQSREISGNFLPRFPRGVRPDIKGFLPLVVMYWLIFTAFILGAIEYWDKYLKLR
jgi:hypothetical protein